jgi:hypothetical protein
MGYNPYRWFTKGRKNRPLPNNAPLLLKIRNGDFNYSYMFSEAEDTRKEATRVYEEAYKNYIGNDEHNRKMAAEDSSRMKRVKALKLMEEAHKNEMVILTSLRRNLESEFGVDLWEKAMEKQRGKGTIEDLYFWYKKQVKEYTTKSEMDIQFKRPNTKGLEHLF